MFKKISMLITLLALQGCANLKQFNSEQNASALNVLFIGNSYTQAKFNNGIKPIDVPLIVEKIAVSQNQTPRLDIFTYARSGTNLAQLLNNRDLINLIKKKPWHFVVIQEQSLGPINHEKAMYMSINQLVELAKAQGAEPILYMTWARKDEPAMIRKISNVYSKIANELEVKVAPVGLIWAEASKKNIDLYSFDGSHQNIKGSFLAATVLYNTITNNKVWFTPKPSRYLPSEYDMQQLLAITKSSQ